MSGYILIVESDPTLQRRIGDTLKEARYELASEAEVAWARRSIAVRTPDAIVVDTMLTDGDGFRFAEDLRRDPETRDTPIFFVASRFRGASHRAEARRRFAPAEYLSVPIDVNSLLALVLEAVPRASTDSKLHGIPAGIHTATTQPIVTAKPTLTPPPIAARTEGTAPRAHVPAPRAAAPGDPAQQRERRDVERTAKTLAMEKTELNGTLKRIPFARVLQRLYARRAGGSLLLLRGATKKIVSFVEGYPVAVRSNVLGECLGQILLEQKSISSQALSESVRRMQKEKRRQGEILVEMGALSPYNLSRALIEQAEAKLFEIFSWRDGQFMFKQGDIAPKEAMRLARSPAALIFEGIRRHYDSARQVAVLDTYAKRFVAPNPDPMLRMQEMSDDPTEMTFIHSIDGNQRLDTVLERALIARDKAGVLLVALSEAGMITPADAPAARVAAALAPVARPVVPIHALHRPSRIPDEMATPPLPLPSSGDVVAGDVDFEADDSEEVGAGDGDLDRDRAPAPDLHRAADGGEPLAADLDAAMAISVAPPASAMPLGSGPLSMVAQTVRTQDFFWALGVDRTATTEEIDSAYDALARTFHADGYRRSPDEDRKLAQEIFERLSEAHRVLRDPTQRRSYAERLARLDARPDTETTPARAGDEPSPAGQAGAPGATTAGNAAAQALYEGGLDHLKALRHHEAVEAFRQAARLVPGAADFRAALGWSLFREAPADARAGRAALAELRRAIQIDGRNLGALYYLASLYAETGQSDLAIEELEKILQIDPDAPAAAEARDQLRRLRSR